VAGDGTRGYSGDGGLATSAAFGRPSGIAVDASGNIYIADTDNIRIRLVTKSTGIVTTVAGTGSYGNIGDGGLATSAALGYPSGVAVDASGNIYIADMSNQRIRLVTKSTGIITTVTGTGSYGNIADGGLATSATLDRPYGIAVDASGNIYVTDTDNSRIRLVMKSTGIITTVAGDGTRGYGGDGGDARLSTLSSPSGIAIDVSGNIYVTDSGNNRLRVLLLAEVPSASPIISPSVASSPTPSPNSNPNTVSTPSPNSSPNTVSSTTPSPNSSPNTVSSPTPSPSPTLVPTSSRSNSLPVTSASPGKCIWSNLHAF
jgi:trimeric autotransporter adhesin